MVPAARLIARLPPRLVSIVIPVFNEEETLPLLRQKLTELTGELLCAVEIIVVNDGSTDRTLPLLLVWATADRRVKVIALARNFGHQAAATAGLDFATGDAAVLMDGDLQDPPDLIVRMVEQYCRGYDVVAARRVEREGESWLKRSSAWAFYRLMRVMVHRDLPPDVGDFRLVSRRCLDALRTMRETHRFLRGMVTWVGFSQTLIDFERPARVAGQTKYSWKRMLRFAWVAAVSFSPAPLRVSFAFAFLVGAMGLLAGAYAVISKLLGIYVAPGWTSLMVVTTVIGSSILVSIGLVGEYLAKVFEEVKRRPLYIVSDTINIEPQANAAGEVR